MSKIYLVAIETVDGKIRKSSIEALCACKHLAIDNYIVAAVLGPTTDAGALAQYGASEVYQAAALESFSGDLFATVMADLNEKIHPGFIAGAATIFGRELMGRLGAKLGRCPATDCTEIHADGDMVKLIRPVYSGKARAIVAFQGEKPHLFTLRPNVFPASAPDSTLACEVRQIMDAPARRNASTKVVEKVKSGSGALDVTEAQVVVSGGRAMKGPENFEILRKLVAAIPNAALGASRAAVDAGWIDHHHQVGQTGKVVSPQLYIACGISGSIQHLAGMSSSKVIVAINKDPDAPIFKFATYGIVGDLFQYIPKITEEMKKMFS